MEIYNRIISRFRGDSREKIKQIINELQAILEINKEPEKKDDHRKKEKTAGSEFDSALKEISDGIADTLQEGLNQLEKTDETMSPEKQESEISSSEPHHVIVSEVPPTDEDLEKSKKKEESDSSKMVTKEEFYTIIPKIITANTQTGGGFVQNTGGLPLGDGSAQNAGAVPATGGGTSQNTGGFPTGGGDGSAQNLGVVPANGGGSSQNTGAVPTTGGGGTTGFNLNIGGGTTTGGGGNFPQNESSAGTETVTTSPFQGGDGQLQEGQTPSANLPNSDWTPGRPEDIQPRIPTAAELLTNLYHSPDWERYSNLPLRDRRSGEDRRKSRKKVPNDRRSGKERRKSNLVNERSKFLNRWKAVQYLKNMQLKAELDANPDILSGFLRGEIASSAEYTAMDLGLPLSDYLSEYPDILPLGLPRPINTRRPDYQDQNDISQNIPDEKIPNVELPPAEQLPPPANEEYIRYPGSRVDLIKINLPDPVTLKYEGFDEAPKRLVSTDTPSLSEEQSVELKKKEDEELAKLTAGTILYPTTRDEKIHSLFRIELPEPVDYIKGSRPPELDGEQPEEITAPEINIIDGGGPEEIDAPEMDTIDIPEIKEPEPEKMIHGILELKPPEVDDAPFLTLTYDFTKIPHSFKLSKNYSLMEYSYYKYKPMLVKAQEFARRKMLKNALNYYRVVKSQNIPPELKHMVTRNITDITEFLEKFLMSKGG
ncbi:MAG TPA: hypothetical protein PKK05_22960 [Leptospiraceae bacterium]|nr:hypothetical protein [Leptospiraceae bacterium]